MTIPAVVANYLCPGAVHETAPRAEVDVFIGAHGGVVKDSLLRNVMTAFNILAVPMLVSFLKGAQ